MTNNNFSKEFNNFIYQFLELPVDFSNPKIDINEYESEYSGVINDVQTTTVTFGDSSQCEVFVRYISLINHEKLKNDYIDRNKNLELLKEEMRHDGYSKEEIDYYTEEETMFAKYEKEEAIGLYKKSVPCDFEGYVVTPHLSISINDNLFQAMIKYDDNEEIVILYGKIDKDGKLQQVTMCSYNWFDFVLFSNCYLDNENYFAGYYFNCDYLVARIENLKSNEGIEPNMQVDLDFKEFLNEIGLDNMYNYPAVAIFLAQRNLMDRAILIEKEQKSNSKNICKKL